MVTHASFFEVSSGGVISSSPLASQLKSTLDYMLPAAPRRLDSEGVPYVDLAESVARQDAIAVQQWLGQQDLHTMQARVSKDDVAIRQDGGVWRLDGAGLGPAARRLDSYSPSMGGAELRDLTFRRPVEREALPPLSIFKHFELDRSIPPGVVDYEMSRIYGAGEAIIYFGGDEVPEVSVGQSTGTRPVRFLVTSYSETIFDRLRSAYRGFDLNGEKRARAEHILYQTANKLFWKGHSTADLWGILNHPYLDQIISSLTAGTSDKDDVIRAISKAAHYATRVSKQVFASNACLMSTKMFEYLATTRLGTTDTVTMLDFLKRANPHIKWPSEGTWELDVAGPAAEDGVLFYRDDQQGITPIVTLAPTALPTQSLGIVDKTVLIMGIGDAYQKAVGNNFLLWMNVNLG